jgi:hypothetical protein
MDAMAIRSVETNPGGYISGYCDIRARLTHLKKLKHDRLQVVKNDAVSRSVSHFVLRLFHDPAVFSWAFQINHDTIGAAGERAIKPALN